MQSILSINEACKAAGVGRTKLYQFINSGQLQANKLGNRTVILKEEMESFISSLPKYPSKNEGE